MSSAVEAQAGSIFWIPAFAGKTARPHGVFLPVKSGITHVIPSFGSEFLKRAYGIGWSYSAAVMVMWDI